MYQRNLLAFVFLALFGCVHPQYHTVVHNAQTQHLSALQSFDAHIAIKAAQAFKLFSLYRGQLKFKDLCTSPFIAELFVRPADTALHPQGQESLQAAQYVMLVCLYQAFFSQYIASTQNLLNDLIGSKKYWFYEDFYMNQSLLRRHPVYLVYSSAYKKEVTSKIAVLDELEEQVACMLGMCLYGTHHIHSIESESELSARLIDAITPLYSLYQVPLSIDASQGDPVTLFHDLQWIYASMNKNMENVKTSLLHNNKPSFVAQHWFGLSCAAASVIAAYVFYCKHEQDMPALREKTINTGKYIWQDYIVSPIDDLINVLWRNQGKKIQYIPRIPRLPKYDMPPFPTPDKIQMPAAPRMLEHDVHLTTWIADTIFNKLITPEWNRLAQWYDDTVDTLFNKAFQANVEIVADWYDKTTRLAVSDIAPSETDRYIAWLEKAADTYVDQTNDLVMKNQQINLALAAIGPVLLVAYFGYKYSCAGYNRFIKHDTWYAPMKYSLRAADQLINTVARGNSHSFVDDGKLYMLITNIKQYIACLENEELILMHKDLDDLLSFHLTYEQKQGVIERMYRTYKFLK